MKLRTKFGSVKGRQQRTSQRTSATGLTVSITHLILSRTPSRVFERLIVVIASSASWRAFSAGDIPARASAGGIRVLTSLGRRSVGGERVSEPVTTVDRGMFVVVVTASSTSRRALSASDIPARRSAAGGIGELISLGRRSAGGESVSDPMATVDRVRFVESGAIEGFVASLGADSLISVDWRLVALIDKTG